MLFFFALAICIGIVCIGLATTRTRDASVTYYPWIIAAVWCIAPFPNLMCTAMTGDAAFDVRSVGSMYRSTGYYMTGGILATACAVPLVLVHAQYITVASGAWAVIGGAIVYAAVSGYQNYFTRETL